MKKIKDYCLVMIMMSFIFITTTAIAMASDNSNDSKTSDNHIQIDSVQVNDSDMIHIEGSVLDDVLEQEPDAQLSLFELATYENPEDVITEREPLETVDITNNFNFEVALMDGDRSRLYSKFVIALVDQENTYRTVSNAHYVINPGDMADNQYPFPKAESKKGLQVKGDMTADAEELGISHAALNVSYNQMLYKDKASSQAGNTIEYTLDGETFYFKKDSITNLDNSVRRLSDNNIIISLILLMYYDDDPDTPNQDLIHPDAENTELATVFALNTTNEKGVKYVKAITNFLAERYTREDKKYGQAVNFIVGNEVGQNEVWNNMGPKTVTKYVDEYARTVRLIETVVKSHYENGRVYISLDHFWDESIPEDAMWKYDNKKIVDLLTEKIRSEGEFPWHIAFHPYPEDLFNPKFWDDESPTNDFNTPRITFKNLEVLVEYMQQENFLFDGDMRRIILSEQGLNDRDNSLESQEVQAAAYAFAYYKTKFLDGIDSFILHRHVDHKLEGGLNLGLWTSLDDVEDEQDYSEIPLEKKIVYDVFKYIDTEKSLDVTEFAKPIIGIDAWEDVIDDFDASILADRTIPYFSGVDFIKKTLHSTTIENFDESLGDWTVSDNGNSIERNTTDTFSGSGALQVNFDATSKLWRGADVKFDQPIDASNQSLISLAVKVPEYDASKQYQLKIKAYSGADEAEGTVIFDPKDGWNQVAMNLGHWDGMNTIDRLKVWVKSTSTDPWSGHFLIDQVELSEDIVPNKQKHNLDLAIDNDALLNMAKEIGVTVSNYADSTLNGNIKIEPSNVIKFNEKHLKLGQLGSGENKVFTLKIEDFAPVEEGPIRIQFKYQGQLIEKIIGYYENLPEKTILFDFEDGVDGWRAGDNVVSIEQIDQFANGPGFPYIGSYALAARSKEIPASSWKKIYVELDEPLDLSDATEFFYHINSYGGIPEGNYETKITLANGTESLSGVFDMENDKWNEIRLNIQNWDAKENITHIELSFRAGSDIDWRPQFQVDGIGFEKPAPEL